mmetsp:Transcript_6239/g.17444  ORF Transcript_6239/g.17444 Transcript_6239/m.17444 type:complete len:330 (-) Transcript_6239:77-1066(-)
MAVLEVDVALCREHLHEVLVHGGHVQVGLGHGAFLHLVLHADAALVVLPEAAPELGIGHDGEQQRRGVDEEERRGQAHVDDGEERPVHEVRHEERVEHAVHDGVANGEDDDGAVRVAAKLHAALEQVREHERAEQERRRRREAEQHPAEPARGLVVHQHPEDDPDAEHDGDVGPQLHERLAEARQRYGGLLEVHGHDHDDDEEEERDAEQLVRAVEAVAGLHQQREAVQNPDEKEERGEARQQRQVGPQDRLAEDLPRHADAPHHDEEPRAAHEGAAHGEEHEPVVEREARHLRPTPTPPPQRPRSALPRPRATILRECVTASYSWVQA